MLIAFIDLETTGLPRRAGYDQYYNYALTKFYDSARIVQIAVVIYEFDGNKLTQTALHDYIIKPDNFKICNAHIHNITDEIANRVGIPFQTAIENIRADLMSCELLVAHNISFDKNILLSELHRYGLYPIIQHIRTNMKYFCTSKDCRRITRIRFNAREYKQPKLIELYTFLFNEVPLDLHNALADTKIMIRCFVEMFDKKMIVWRDGMFQAV